MDVETVIIELAQKQGELTAYERMFDTMNGRVGRIDDRMEKMDDKLEQLLVREGERVGEIRGVRRSAAVIATIISLAVGAAAFAVR